MVVEFATPSALVPSVASPVNIGELVAAAAGFSAEFEMEANNTVVRLDELDFTPATTPTEVALVEFATVAVNASNSVPITAQGQISPGTTLVPDDPENWELDRRQSVIDHELTHTFQSAQLGPLLFGLFPTFVFRIVTDLTTRTEFELPKFSAYVDGEITEEGRGRFLKIPEMHGIPFAEDDIIQVSQRLDPNQTFLAEILSKESETRLRISSNPQAPVGPVLARPVSLGAMLSADVKQVGSDRVLDIPDPQGVTFEVGSLVHIEVHEMSGATTLGKRGEGNVFAISAGPEVPNGSVRVRREKSGNRIWGKIFRIAELLTPGELATRVVGLTWGNLIYFAGKGIYALFSGRKDRRHRATVSEAHDSLNCGAKLPDDLREVSRVVIYSATGTIIRNVTKVTGAVLELSSKIEFAGEVEVAAYERRSGAGKYDWKTYYPASVPDPGRPNAIKIEEADGERLKLDPVRPCPPRRGREIGLDSRHCDQRRRARRTRRSPSHLRRRTHAAGLLSRLRDTRRRARLRQLRSPPQSHARHAADRAFYSSHFRSVGPARLPLSSLGQVPPLAHTRGPLGFQFALMEPDFSGMVSVGQRPPAKAIRG